MHYLRFFSLLFFLLIGISQGNDVHIHNASDFVQFSNNVNNGTAYEGTTVYLDNDVDFTGHTLTPIGNTFHIFFRGTFDGQGHVISNLRMNETTLEFTGVFGYSLGTIIKNVVIDDSCSILSSFNSGVFTYIGSIMSCCRSYYDLCIIENIVNMADVTFSGNISSNLHFGGIIGVSWSSVNYESIMKNCVNYGTATNNGTIKEYCDIGGIVGHCRDGIKYVQNCINYGTLHHNGLTSKEMHIGGIVGFVRFGDTDINYGETYIKNCLSVGKIIKYNEPLSYIGIIIGNVDLNNTVNINNCFWTNDTGYEQVYGHSDSDIIIDNSSITESSTEAFNSLIEYGFTDDWEIMNILHLNGGNINGIKQETIVMTQKHFPDPVKEGNTFLFWCEDNYCKEKYNSSTSTATDIYAIWNKITVTLNVNGGNKLSNSTIIVIFNNTYGNLPIPTKHGYYFIGWFNDNNENVTNESIVAMGRDHTLRAQWEAIPSSKVEIVFGTKDLTEDKIIIILKQYTDADFEIIKFDDSNPDEIRVIIKFIDVEKAESFVETIKASSGRSRIKYVEYFVDYIESFSMLYTPLFFFKLFF